MSSTMKYLSSDVYGITELIEDIKTKHIDGVDSITLAMSIFGYFSEVSSSMMQSAIVMASEYANEAIPVKAKFEKNIITHALSLGIEKLNAQPASIRVQLAFPEDVLVANMKNNTLTLDREMKIMIGGFEYHLDYDTKIIRNLLGNGDYVYTGMYDLSRPNPISTITNPYLLPIGRITYPNGVPHILVTVPLHQVEYKKISKKILSTNPLETKIITFDFEGQLAAFDVDVTENSTEYHLTPVYDGLIDYTSDYWINYSYLDINNIRLKFDSDSYNPKLNADVDINVYTTQGSEGNFTYTGEPFVYQFESTRFSYNKLYAQIFMTTSLDHSANGADRKSIKELKKLIPKEALSRGSITNAQDLNNYFNSINDDDTLLFFHKKLDNTLARLYYSFLLMRRDNIIIPTNTIPVTFIKNDFDKQTNGNYSLYAGNLIQYDGVNYGSVVIKEDDVDAQVEAIEEAGKFAYMNPFLCVVNKLPLYMSYYLTIINANKFLEFEYINANSQIQFIGTNADWTRKYFTDRYKYKMDFSVTQNIQADMGLAVYDSEGNVTDINARVFLVIYDSDGNPYRYKSGNFVSFNEEDYTATFNFTLTTDDSFDSETSRIQILDLCEPGQSPLIDVNAYLTDSVSAKIFVYVKNSDGSTPTRPLDVDAIIQPTLNGITEYSLCNIYNIQNGIDFFYNYSHIMNSSVIIKQQSDTSLTYSVTKFPLVRYSYMDTEERVTNFTNQLEVDRNYIDSCLEVLEDSFGIDFKFFNTYGPSELFTITGDEMIDRVNISVKFKCQLNSTADQYIETKIKDDIKAYIENINDGMTDLHMENLVTTITTKYAEQIVYFDFIEVNDYGTDYKHIYRPSDDLVDMVPEFLNINTLKDGTYDITIDFV